MRKGEERVQLRGPDLVNPQAFLAGVVAKVSLALGQKAPGEPLGRTKRQFVEPRGLWDKFRSLSQEVAERGE